MLYCVDLPSWIQALAAVGALALAGWSLAILRKYAADTKKIADASVSQTENSQMPFLALAMREGTRDEQGGWMIENQGFGPAINIRFSEYIEGRRSMRPIPPLAKGGSRFLHNQISTALSNLGGFEIVYESLSGEEYRTSVAMVDNVPQTQFHKA